MIDILKKAVYTGMALASITGEKLEEFAEKMAKEADMTAEETRKFYDDLVKKSEKAKKDLKLKVDEQVQDSLERMNVPTQKRIEKLDERIANLEKWKADVQKKGNDNS